MHATACFLASDAVCGFTYALLQLLMNTGQLQRLHYKLKQHARKLS